ncbi:hypothetical protein, partial [Candidatus Albibeggiatoa sp. nov. NOAA]|uniref:hypothetical protein n=1 Tax=Candidatus Albibeggiatoa sp. nov. NOAA TaxID=3162724 RepID=UPI003301A2A9|nr:hypothetical protein [Thiotrichaceae bacterium]
RRLSDKSDKFALSIKILFWLHDLTNIFMFAFGTWGVCLDGLGSLALCPPCSRVQGAWSARPGGCRSQGCHGYAMRSPHAARSSTILPGTFPSLQFTVRPLRSNHFTHFVDAQHFLVFAISCVFEWLKGKNLPA